MSLQGLSQADSEAEVRRQLEAVTAPHESSRQARPDAARRLHNDGERIYKDFNIQPFHKYLWRNEQRGKNVASYPSAWVGALLHLEERELELLEALRDDGVQYEPGSPRVEHPALEEIWEETPLRAKTLEWVAADDGYRTGKKAKGSTTVDCFTAGGTDLQIYGEPGSGKTTLAEFVALTKQQLNNETVIWADSLDSSLTSERCEWVLYAPYTTVAVPAHVDVEVTVHPKAPGVSSFRVELEEIVRDVLEYESPLDLVRQLEPGQFYVTYPDPTFAGCEDVSSFAYHSPGVVDRDAEGAPNSVTPPNHWWFAFWAARVTHDEFLHWTTLLLDEAGNLLDPDASKDEHQTYQKLVWFMEKFADARKKGVSLDTMTHAITEIHEKTRRKQRRWLTMNGTAPPLGKTLPGEKTCPMKIDYTTDMDKGEAQVWTTKNYASINWPNLKRGVRLDAEIDVSFSVPGVDA